MDMTMDCPTPTDSMVTVPLSDENQADGETRSSSSTTTTSDAASVGGSSSSNSQLLTDEQPVDRESSWAELDRTEEQEPRSEDSDESTALLLARLEQENTALATNPKSGLSPLAQTANAGAGGSSRAHHQSRAESLHHIKRLIADPSRSSLRYSQLPAPPPMTELEFWAALVANFPQTAQRLPTLTSNKIRGGVPPPLRGVVWPSMAGARDTPLLAEFERLSGESSPYEGLIGKDIGRSFPTVDMFRDSNGEGQRMLARVLRSFSLYDSKIGYCQGLAFVVGPLLMHMTDAEAFCVLVRLMDHYRLRTCYLPDLSGLHLRVYQFQKLLSRHRPALFAHLESLNVEPIYASQWFLSFFAVTCPLPMLLRIYDVIFLEGASETLMRVALSLMQRNEKKIMACTEFEDVLSLLLSRSLWDVYACNADDLVNDFVSLTSLVTEESLKSLEASYSQSQGVSTGISVPQMQAAASRFLGRLWAGNSSSAKSNMAAPTLSLSRPSSTIRRSASKQSMTSTLNSIESTSSDASTALTDLSAANDSHAKPRTKSAMSQNHSADRDLHTQIEELLMALSDLQRQHAELTQELQREREDGEESREVARKMLHFLRQVVEVEAADEEADEDEDEDVAELDTNAEELDTGKTTAAAEDSVKRDTLDADEQARGKAQKRSKTKKLSTELIARAEEVLEARQCKRSSIIQTKHQLRDEATRWKEMHQTEASRCSSLTRRIDEQEVEAAQLRDQLREARSRIQDGYRDRQRLERIIRDLRAAVKPCAAHQSHQQQHQQHHVDGTQQTEWARACSAPCADQGDSLPVVAATSGLRELRLVRSNSQNSAASPSPALTPTFNKRSSSLGVHALLLGGTTDSHASSSPPPPSPAPDETLLHELVRSKTAEAVARQELEEVKGKLEALRKLVSASSGNSSTIAAAASSSLSRPVLQKSNSSVSLARVATEPSAASGSGGGGGGGFFSSWGRRAVSTSPDGFSETR